MSMFDDIRSFMEFKGAGLKRVSITLAANGIVNIPAGYGIQSIYFRNKTTAAVTGGIRIGSTDTGTELVVAQAIASSVRIKLADSALVKAYFSPTASTPVYIQAVTAWNSATVLVVFILVKLE